jgi:hypothetical protein
MPVYLDLVLLILPERREAQRKYVPLVSNIQVSIDLFAPTPQGEAQRKYVSQGPVYKGMWAGVVPPTAERKYACIYSTQSDA